MGPYVIKDTALLTSLVGKAAVIPATDAGFGVQCVGLVKMFSSCGPAFQWKKGANVHTSKNLVPGTVIATFNTQGVYANHATGNHACFFVRLLPDGSGILVLEQHVPPNPNKIQTRAIKFFGAGSSVNPSNNADALSVVM